MSDNPDYSKALEDINFWIESHSALSKDEGHDLTEQEVNNFYNSLPYQPTIVTKDKERSVKKRLNPEGFTVEPGTEENLIQLILQLRRLETMQEGLRWFDLKRYGIEFMSPLIISILNINSNTRNRIPTITWHRPNCPNQ